MASSHPFPGFPPPDHAIRDLLTRSQGEEEEKNRMLHFLHVLFEKTRNLLEINLNEAKTRSERITMFREYVTAGQNIERVGEDRREFYKTIVDEVEAVSLVYYLSSVFLHFTEDGE